MIQKRRLDTIMGILKDEGMVDVKTLSQRLEVTEKTVRLDLKGQPLQRWRGWMMWILLLLTAGWTRM